jgi:hypothetical protein
VRWAAAHVRFGSKADISVALFNVRFTPKSGHWLSMLGCLLCAKKRTLCSAQAAIRSEIRLLIAMVGNLSLLGIDGGLQFADAVGRARTFLDKSSLARR